MSVNIVWLRAQLSRLDAAIKSIEGQLVNSAPQDHPTTQDHGSTLEKRLAAVEQRVGYLKKDVEGLKKGTK